MTAIAQTPYGAKPYKGPRALGLIELPQNGKPRFVPIAILINGEFYDASAYKASPVPMALWSATVYEGFVSGVSQGLFTVTTALEDQKTNEWIADGQWEPAGSGPKKVAKKPESSVPRGIDEDSGPPVLRHSGAKKPAPPETPSSNSSSTAAAKTDTQSGDKTKPDSQAQTPPAQKDAASASSTPATSTEAAAQAQTPTPAPTTQTPEQDPDAPVLKRGKPTTKPSSLKSQPAPTATGVSSSKPSSSSAKAAPTPAKVPQLRLITAISDSGGPDPRPYKYDLRPEDEAVVRKKLFALAANEVAARNKQLAPETAQAPARTSSKRAQSRTPAQPDFQNVQLRAFDLSFSNEPVFVLSANSPMPKPLNAEGSTDSNYSITLVAREDINGDMHKTFAEVTDADHLDVLPRYELIDAVDADGDGRAELLFRQISDQGSTFAIYRVIGDRLYPLFQTAR